MGKRGRVRVCSCCGHENDRPAQRYCAGCHSAYMREWRKTHPMGEGQRFRDNCRSYAGVYRKRGAIPKQPCTVCGSADSEMHHPDHEQPLQVTWLCRPCHLAWHSFWKPAVLEIFDQWVADLRAAVANQRKAA